MSNNPQAPHDNQRPTETDQSNRSVTPNDCRPCAPGRPAVLDPDRRQQIVALLTVGCSRRIAARHVGCSPSTITRTAARDPDFAGQVARAETNVDVELLGAIRQAAKNDRYWRAAGWLLERRNPHDFMKHPSRSYTAEQVIQLLVATLDTLRDAIPAPQRNLAIQTFGNLLLEFDEGSRHSPSTVRSPANDAAPAKSPP